MTHERYSDPATQLALTIARAAEERKGQDILLLRVAEVSYLADYFVLVTGYSPAQVRAIARSIEEQAAQQCHRRPRHQEGSPEGGWVLQDYGDVIVHIFLPRERAFYDLERFWAHAERLAFAPVG
ncbi:MAG: ribosome silencing factor [Gloeomargarita sp. SKYBB_i_bin120]|nr:ribosome silencing factor [Gloeomargarita sp. SKYG98]MCS7291467.1 ribosome silencing factor [Gloeomargarita sp. SKYB120]MDW8177027.1 ribosome silencing factor [Gloeomargarita sp. SKYBB_i_bin120]